MNTLPVIYVNLTQTIQYIVPAAYVYIGGGAGAAAGSLVAADQPR